MKATRTLRAVLVVDQEVGADVQLAVVFLVEARRLLEVVVDRVLGIVRPKCSRDPALFLVGGASRSTQIGWTLASAWCALDLFLEEPAVGQREDVQHEGSGEHDRSLERTITEDGGMSKTASRRCGDEIIASACRLPANGGVPFATAID